MKLEKLLENLNYEVYKGKSDMDVTTVVNRSDKAEEGSAFVCITGAVSDGHQYAKDAVNRGARVVVAEKFVDVPDDVTVIRVKDTRYALALMSAAYYGYPAEKLTVIGVTGTKGKTTTAYMIRSVLEKTGHRTGLIGTVEIIIGERRIPSCNTTPESCDIQKYFAEMLEEGCDTVVMEVSSQGLMLHRTAGIGFAIGIFTNLGKDHIGPDEHRDFEDYKRCKSLLFRQCRLAIVNGDDPFYRDILRGSSCRVLRYGFGEDNELRAGQMEFLSGKGKIGVAFHMSGLTDVQAEVEVPGRFTVYNALAAAAVCLELGADAGDIVRALRHVRVKGRAELVPVSDEIAVMIDYAHNAMSLQSLLETLREYAPARLVCLFGCGGNRSRDRRFEMGRVSGKLADLTIITSDNPRFEDPKKIMEDIRTGIRETDGAFVEIQDRREAVRYAVAHAEPGDVIVIAGKGHEDYQEICGKKYPMDDRILIEDAVRETCKER